jgi:colanic acid/amylovoran biosynthesis glycosyltransferase
MNHITYDAFVIYKEFIGSPFAHDIIESMPSFNCDNKKKGLRKKYSDFLYGKPFRRLTSTDKKEILHYLKIHEIDIIHYHYGTDATLFFGAAPKEIPSVVSFYGYDCSSFPKWYLGLGAHFLRRVFNNVCYCLAMSEDMRLDLLRIGCPEDKIIVHYYGTDVGKFAADRVYDENDEVIFLSVGYLVPQKGHAFTLKAFKKALQRTSKLMKLRIVGGGPLEPGLRKYVSQNGLSNHVDFVGPLEHLGREFLREFRGADVFIHPSVTSDANEKEGIPGAIVEAMASGLPVISTYHAGIPHIVHNGQTGLLVDEWDVEALAKAILEFAENVDLRERIGLAGRKHAFDNLDLRQKQIELENIYDRVIEEHRLKIQSHFG